MKKFMVAVYLTALSGLLNAQNIFNDPNAEVRKVNSFHGIHISGGFEVILSQGSEESLAVSASDKDKNQFIQTSVENGILKISYKEGNKWWNIHNRKLKAYISVRNLDEIKGGGATNIILKSDLTAPSLKLNLGGASDLAGKLLVSGKLEVELGGASDLSISGFSEDVEINAGGASRVRAFEFKANICNVKASGASDINITAEKEISVKLSGASSFNYKGAAVVKNIKTSGSSYLSHKS